MIHSQDRTLWIGASDADKIVGNWNTKTWENWWAEKLGLIPTRNFQSKYTKAGTYYEHEILRSLGLPITYDHQVKIEDLRLRINYDGVVLSEPHIYEVKTYGEGKDFKVSKTYWRQAQLEMLGLKTDKLDIVAYPMSEENYNNYFIPIEEEKRQLFKVERDDDFINNLALPRLEILAKCLKEGRFPERN